MCMCLREWTCVGVGRLTYRTQECHCLRWCHTHTHTQTEGSTALPYQAAGQYWMLLGSVFLSLQISHLHGGLVLLVSIIHVARRMYNMQLCPLQTLCSQNLYVLNIFLDKLNYSQAVLRSVVVPGWTNKTSSPVSVFSLTLQRKLTQMLPYLHTRIIIGLVASQRANEKIQTHDSKTKQQKLHCSLHLCELSLNIVYYCSASMTLLQLFTRPSDISYKGRLFLP